MTINTVDSMQYLGESFLSRVRNGIFQILKITSYSKEALTSGATKENNSITQLEIGGDVGPIPDNCVGPKIKKMFFPTYTRTSLLQDENFPYGALDSCVIECADGKMYASGVMIGGSGIVDDDDIDTIYPVRARDRKNFSWANVYRAVNVVEVPIGHEKDVIVGGDFASLEKIIFPQGATEIVSSIPNAFTLPHLSCIVIPSSVTALNSRFFELSDHEELTTVSFLGRNREDVKKMTGYPWGVKSGQPIVFYCLDGVIVPQDELESGYIVPYGTMSIADGQFSDRALTDDEYWYFRQVFYPRNSVRWYRERDKCLVELAEELNLPDGEYIVHLTDVISSSDTWFGVRRIKKNKVVAIPPTVEDIGSDAFSFIRTDDGLRIKRLIIPYGVRHIGDRSFLNALTCVVSESSVSKEDACSAYDIKPKAYPCQLTYNSVLKRWIAAEPTPGTTPTQAGIQLDFVGGIDRNKGTINPVVRGTCGNGNFVIPNTVTRLGDEAFAQSCSFSIRVPYETKTRLFRNSLEAEAIRKIALAGIGAPETVDLLVSILFDKCDGKFCESSKFIPSNRLKRIPFGAFLNVDFTSQLDLSKSKLTEIGSFSFGFSTTRFKKDGSYGADIDSVFLRYSPSGSNAMVEAKNRIPSGCSLLWKAFCKYS